MGMELLFPDGSATCGIAPKKIIALQEQGRDDCRIQPKG